MSTAGLDILNPSPTVMKYYAYDQASDVAMTGLNNYGMSSAWTGLPASTKRNVSESWSFNADNSSTVENTTNLLSQQPDETDVIPNVNVSVVGSVLNAAFHFLTSRLPDHTDDPLMVVISLLIFIVTFIFVLRYPLQWCWDLYNRHSAKDPDSPFSHLPMPPGEFGLPLIGETWSWMMEGTKFNSNRRKKYGNVFKTNIIGTPMVRVTGQQYVKEVLLGEHETVTTIWPSALRSILGENVIVNSTGALHRLRRKITYKAFTRDALNGYIPSLQHQARKNVQEMATVERPRVYDKVLRLTFDLATTSLLGFDLEKPEFKKSIDLFYILVSNIICLPVRIPGFGFSKAMNAREEILVLLHDHILTKKERITKELLNDEEDQENTALDIILRETIKESLKYMNQDSSQYNNNNNNNDENCKNFETQKKAMEHECDELTLKEVAMELMFAGYYTTASALTSCILELAKNPNVFQTVEKELLHHGLLRESPDEVEVDIDLKLIHQLTYLEQVVKETLRKRPPVLGAYRKALKTFQIGDYRIPKGWSVIYNIRDTHEFEYEDTETFDPDRFAPGKGGNEKFRFLGFGGGPRTCVGREFARLVIKIALIEMFRNYEKWDLVNEGLPKMKAIPTLYPADGLPCFLYPRKEFGIVNV